MYAEIFERIGSLSGHTVIHTAATQNQKWNFRDHAYEARIFCITYISRAHPIVTSPICLNNDSGITHAGWYPPKGLSKNHLLRFLSTLALRYAMIKKHQGKLPFFGQSTSCRVPFPFPTFPSNYSDTRTKTSFRPSKNIDPKNSRVVMRNFDRESADCNLKIVLGKPKLRPQFKRHTGIYQASPGSWWSLGLALRSWKSKREAGRIDIGTC